LAFNHGLQTGIKHRVAITVTNGSYGGIIGQAVPLDLANKHSVCSSKRSYDENLQAALWEVSSKLTGVEFEALAATAPEQVAALSPLPLVLLSR